MYKQGDIVLIPIPFTEAQSIVIKKFGTIKKEPLASVIEKIYNVLALSEDIN